MLWAWPLVLIAGGILGCAGLIVAKKPDAKELIGKLQPFQAGIGVALLVFGIYNLLQVVRMMSLFSVIPVTMIAALAAVGSAIILGIMFGMPMVAKLSAGGAAKGEELGKKLAPYQTLVGIIAIASALYFLIIVNVLHKAF